MAKNKNLEQDGKATQFPHNDPTKGGRKPSIRKQLEEMIGDNGNYTIAADQVLKVNDDGSVLVDIPTANKLTLKLLQWADSNKGNDSLKALQVIMEQIDGKSKQEIEQTVIEEKPFVFEIIDGRKPKKQISLHPMGKGDLNR